MSILSRVDTIWREEGLRSLWFKVLGETVYRRLILIERDPGLNPAKSHCLLEDAKCRALEPGEIDAYCGLQPKADPAEVLRRLQAGHQCFAVWKDDRVINAGWVGTGRCRIDYLDLDVELSSDTGYLYEVFTAPEFRGNRVSSARFAYQNAVLSAQGYRRTIAAIWPENPSVARSAARASFREIGMVGYLGAGPLKRGFCRYDGSTPAIRLG